MAQSLKTVDTEPLPQTNDIRLAVVGSLGQACLMIVPLGMSGVKPIWICLTGIGTFCTVLFRTLAPVPQKEASR